MKKPNITPGEWHLSFETHPHFNPVSPIPLVKTGELGPNSKQLAYVCQQNVALAEKYANAHAIAALPVILEALESFVEVGGSIDLMRHSSKVQNAKAALTKAGYTF